MAFELTRTDPWTDLLRLPAQMDRLLSTLWDFPRTTEFAPGVPIDVYENDKEVVLEVELPGVNKDDIHLQMEEDVLVIEGERKAPQDERRWLRRERDYGAFRRALRIPFAVDQDKISAKYDDGILEIRLPKAEPEGPKPTEIKIK